MNFAVSWSRLECFETCSLKSYWLDYAPKHLKIKQGTSPILEKGKLWHSWMEKALKYGDERLPSEVARFKPLVKALRKSKGELLVEQKLTLTEKYRKCDWFSKQAYWRTIYDALVIDEHSISCDWKTGKVKDKASDQLKFSAAAAMLSWPKIKRIDNYYVWLEHPDTPPTKATFERYQLPAIMTEFEERVEMIKICAEEQAWQPQPSPLCAYCPCTKAHCKYGSDK